MELRPHTEINIVSERLMKFLKALRRLIKEILIGPEGMDIYYYYNSLAEEKSLGVLSVETESVAKVLSLRAL